MNLTDKQKAVLNELRKIGRESAYRYKVKQPSLHKWDMERIAKGDQHCAFGMGGLSGQVGYSLGMSASSVLAIFKALQKRGLVVSELNSSGKPRCLYWWPVGLAAELQIELGISNDQTS